VLSKYFGIHTVSDLAARIALDQFDGSVSDGQGRGAQSQGSGDDQRTTAIAPTNIEKRLIELMFDTSEGGRTIYQLINDLNEQINAAEDSEQLRQAFGRLVQIHYANGPNGPISLVDPEEVNVPEQQESGDGDSPTITEVERVSIRQMLGYGDNETRINSRPTEPSKEHPGLSIVLSNSPRVSLESQNVGASTIFFNGVPNIELSRAVPYINIDFFFPAPPTGPNDRMQTLSLTKFLEGAKEVRQGSPLELMTQANTTEGTLVSTQQAEPDQPVPEIYSVAGMELFTSPQTLVNADVSAAPSAERSNPVLDKFRPLMSLQDLTISVAPSAGMMAFKRGEMTIILHDRSRLPEVARFVKPDLYGQNEIQIEYGWSHPDGGLVTTVNGISTSRNGSLNPYGDLIDGMRVKEKYMVVNSSFNFDSSGQVIIKLNIAMRGAAAFNTELMSSDNQTFGNLIQEIEELQNTIAELRERVFPPSTASTQREIRGRQILDAAQDAMSHPNLTNDLREALRDFRRAYQNSSNPSARELVQRIESIFGDDVRRRRRGETLEPRLSSGEPTVVQRLRNTIADSVRRKMSVIQSSPDPFLVNDAEMGQRRLLAANESEGLSAAESRRLRQFESSALQVTLTSQQPVSLAKLLLAFVGEPLANSGQYDDIQLIFYPFNEKAGKANRLNIGNFIVDADYFADELARYRLSHVGRSSVMSLREFVQFVGDTIVDDPAAPSYGLKDERGPLFEAFVDDDGRVRGTRAVDEAPNHQTRLQAVLQGVTPDGTFAAPQIELYVEALPQLGGTADGEDTSANNGKTILRLHFFDRQSTSYESLGRLLRSTRTETLQSVGRFPPIQGGNTGAINIRRDIANTTLAAAEATGLVQKIPANSPPGQEHPSPVDVQYRLIGGPQKLKEFIMQNSPYIIYGAAGTTVKNAQLASLQEPALNTVNLIRSFRREESITPNGEDAGGLPMQIIPTQLSVECFGNPLLQYAQQYFIDFQSGTTADNFYSVIGIDHSFKQGDFTTQISFGPADAWGEYRSFIGSIQQALDVLREVENEQQQAGVDNDTGQSRPGTGQT